jgi:hypothetical protein
VLGILEVGFPFMGKYDWNQVLMVAEYGIEDRAEQPYLRPLIWHSTVPEEKGRSLQDAVRGP